MRLIIGTIACCLPVRLSYMTEAQLLGLYAAVYADLQRVSVMPPSLCQPMQMIIKMAAM